MECVGSWSNNIMEHHIIPVEDSYAQRRRLFKNIWDTAMTVEEKDADIMTKPKVIKTLRLDSVDRCRVNKKKKQKLRNLRTVCNKILDFCDKQDADDLFYEQMNNKSQGPTHQTPPETKQKKTKNAKSKKKVKKSNSISLPTRDLGQPRPTISERKNKLTNKTSHNNTPLKQTAIVKNATVKTTKGPRNLNVLAPTKVCKKTGKKKKLSHSQLIHSSGPTKYYYNISAAVPYNQTKQPKPQIQVHKINIM